MEKILSEHRKLVGDFEFLQVVDESEIAALRAQIDLEAPIDINWTWNYGSEVAELRALYEKGKTAQWNATTDLDWGIPVTRDDWVMNPEASALANICKLMGKDEATQREAAFDEVSWLISQLLHGEQAALQICGQLTNVCDKMDQKFYAASQTIDEARHVEVMARFLSGKMGALHPISPTLKTLLDILLQAEGMQKKILGMQVLFEGTAVGIMEMLRSESKNPLLSEMLRRVAQDESRHAAFGVLQMRRVVRDASTEEKNEMEDWAFSILEALNANQNADMLRLFAPKYGFEVEPVVQAFTSMPEFVDLNSSVYMHTVVPNLRNLGLITERTAGGWLSKGMMTPAATAGAPLPIAGC
ncbi:MAG: diiron oxygenase [Myxococcota bacterium]